MPTPRIMLSALQAHHLFAALEKLPKPLDRDDGKIAEEFTQSLGFPITRSHIRHARVSLGIPSHKESRVQAKPKTRIAFLLDAIAALEARVSKLEARRQ